jgi:hypothetical protein
MRSMLPLSARTQQLVIFVITLAVSAKAILKQLCVFTSDGFLVGKQIYHGPQRAACHALQCALSSIAGLARCCMQGMDSSQALLKLQRNVDACAIRHGLCHSRQDNYISLTTMRVPHLRQAFCRSTHLGWSIQKPFCETLKEPSA